MSNKEHYSPEKAFVPDQGGLEVVPNENLPQVVPGYKMNGMEPVPVDSGRGKTIFGLRRTTFILAALLALVIIGAAVGGGVGGSKAVSQAYE